MARRTARKVNLAWWLDKLSVPLVVAALLGACLVLVVRRELEVFPWLAAGVTGAVLFLAIALLSWWRARPSFESEEDSMVRIEASMRLRNALSAARCGMAPWPAPSGPVDDGTRWRWARLIVPLLASAVFVGASAFLPVSPRSGAESAPVEEPQAWKDIEADLEALDREDTVQEQYLEEMEERLEEMRRKDPDEWFSHSSLEATDTLQRLHRNEVENLERNLRQAERALRALQKHGDQMGEAARARLLNEFNDALEQMGKGKMKPNRELLDQLGEIDPAKLRNLSKEQLDQLRKQMQKHARNCRNCKGGQNGEGPGGGPGAGEDWLDELLAQGEDPRPGHHGGSGREPGPAGEGAGREGVNRGPGTSPGVLGREGGDLKTGGLEGVESKDLSRSLPGDLLELRDGEHDIDRSRIGVRAGGDVAGQGEGGDRVWKDALLPAEKKALKEFFQ